MLSSNSFSDADKRLYTLLVYGVTERLVTIDYIISKLSSIPCEKIDSGTLCCLRLGIYQLKYTDRIPDHAAVSETVSLAKTSSKGFVNAVLREFIRRGKDIPFPDESDGNYLAVKYSCPRELCDFFVKKLGRRTAEDFLAATLAKRGTDIRVNTLATTADILLQERFPDGVKHSLCGDVITVPHIDVSGIGDGLWFVQDAASCMTAEALGALPGETVVDTCAAPGGKSFSIAMRMKNLGRLYSFDLHENKVSLIRSGAERLGITIIEASCRDAAEPMPSLLEKADRVLCDAPCSGLGVIGKKPDIKYKSLEAIERLPSVQRRILKGASAYVKKGGVLVYSTCTVNPDENESVVESFLAENRDFKLAPLEAAGIDEPMKTFFPSRDGTDGFFAAKLKRKI